MPGWCRFAKFHSCLIPDGAHNNPSALGASAAKPSNVGSKGPTALRRQNVPTTNYTSSLRVEFPDLDGGVLPLSKSIAGIALGGKTADDIGNQCGGWTVTWQGKSGNVTTGTIV